MSALVPPQPEIPPVMLGTFSLLLLAESQAPQWSPNPFWYPRKMRWGCLLRPRSPEQEESLLLQQNLLCEQWLCTAV